MNTIKLVNSPSTFKNIDCHLGRIALKNMKKWKNDVHQVELSSDKVNTHEEVMLRSVRVAEGLQSRGLGVGDLIVICGKTHNYMGVPILASFYIGATVFPYSVTMTIGEVKRMLEQGTPKIIFCDPCMEEIFTKALQELNIHVEIVIFGDVHRDSDTTLTHITPFSEFLKPTGTEDSFEVTDFDPDTTIAVILSSSGTSGFPKGVCHTHKSIGLPMIITEKLREQDPNLIESGYYMTFSNYFWVGSTAALITCFISNIPRIICSQPFTEDLLQKGLKKYKPTKVLLYPVAVNTILKSKVLDDLDFSCVKTIIVCGSPSSEDAISAIRAKLTNGTVVNNYGCTEFGSTCSNFYGKKDSVGKVFSWVNWKIVHVDTRTEVKAGEVGELCVTGDSRFKYYFNNPKATEQAIDEDGYFKTGDLFKYDEEGYLYFVDRLKELIKFRIFHVSPAEVEAEILKLPGVQQVCVVGKEHEIDGEHPMAFVQKIEGSSLTQEDIQNAVKNTLSVHKHLIGGVVFTGALPQTVSGKISRSAVREMARHLKHN